MNSRWTSLLAATLVAACGGSEPPARPAAATGGSTPASPEAEARELGAEALVVYDQVAAYAKSRRRMPTSLREAGVDSLTPGTARWLTRDGQDVRVWVGYRQPAGRTLAACSVDGGAREDASLATGTYRALCRTLDGTRRTVEVAEE